MKKQFLITAACAALAPFAANAAVVTNGDLSMGLFDNATLGDGGVGIALAGNGDAITPGCLCEGWGAAANGVGNWGYGNAADFGIVSASLTDVTASSATSTTVLSNGLTVVHEISGVPGGELFQVNVTMMNTSGANATDIRYARTLDWDVNPGHFEDDFTTINGGAAPVGPGNTVYHTSFDPFAAPDPMATRGSLDGSPGADTNGTDVPGDLGSYFIFSFGDLLAGESETFTTYIGAALSTTDLLSAFAAVDIEAFSYSYDNDGDVTFGYGFTGLGIPPVIGVPAPAVIGLFGFGLAGLVAARRRRA